MHEDQTGQTLSQAEFSQGPGHGQKNDLKWNKTADQEHGKEHLATLKTPFRKNITIGGADDGGYGDSGNSHLDGIPKIDTNTLALNPDTGTAPGGFPGVKGD